MLLALPYGYGTYLKNSVKKKKIIDNNSLGTSDKLLININFKFEKKKFTDIVYFTKITMFQIYFTDSYKYFFNALSCIF
jgi:hypothetical protein